MQEEVTSLLQHRNVSKAIGPDDESAQMIKRCASYISRPIQIIFQNIIDAEIFPDQWKEAGGKPVDWLM